jgi:alanine or glycine:cation symporter, AGCS family
MLDLLTTFMTHADNFLWTYVAAPFIITMGIYFSYRFNCPQLFKITPILKTFFYSFFEKKDKNTTHGVHPLHAFFASIGGCIGIGNVAAVCTAIKIGGPGALFWIWVAAFLGMIIKYAEVYLGVKFRVNNQHGSFDGGPMYYLQRVFKASFIPQLIAILLAIYGTDVYMFNVMTHTLVTHWGVNLYVAIGVLLACIIYAANGGVARVGKVCSIIIPIFLLLFILMGSWVLIQNYTLLGSTLKLIFSSAFTGHAAIGGFAGSSLLLAFSQGIARGCYSADIGIGFAAVVHAETRCSEPKKQARLAIVGVFIDTFVVCTATTLIVLVTQVWKTDLAASHMVQAALAQYFPYMNVFMPILILLLGYSTLVAFFCVGLKCATFLFKENGRTIYIIYALLAFILFSFVDETQAMLLMSIAGALLLSLNLLGLYRLKHEISL